MTCDEIRERGPLYLSGEMIGAERARFAAHLAACRSCELEMEAYALVDARISAALCGELPDASHIAARVRHRMMWPGWMAAGAIAAGLLLVAGGTYALLRPTPAPAWYAAAARDHRDEVTEGQPRRWRTEPSEIQTVAAEGGLSLAQSQELAAPGYVLEGARRCGISGQPMLHLLFSNGIRRYSVFVSRHQGVKTEVSQLHSGAEEVAGFETGRLRAAIVTAGAASECEELARLAASRL